MSERIEPALSAEEWKTPTLVTGGYIDVEAGVFDVDLRAVDGERDPDRSARALIALLNSRLPDSDPRKITREMTRRLREANGDALYVIAEEVADALESYLPPE